jgi:SAM-dependent methyltransferase
MTVNERKLRESEFHNRRFEAETEPREALGTVYRLMLPANMHYHAIVESYRDGGRVLEYGCGNGTNTLVFARRGVAITGIDISESGVTHARAQAARVGLDTEFEVMDAENLRFEDGSFAAVAGKGILHHLDIEKAYGEIARVLTPDGRAVFIEPLGHNPLINWFRRCTPEARTPDERPLLIADLEKARSHFRTTEFTFFNLTTLCAVPFRSEKTFATVYSLCEKFDSWLFRTSPWIARYSWMVFMDMRHPIRSTGIQSARCTS